MIIGSTPRTVNATHCAPRALFMLATGCYRLVGNNMTSHHPKGSASGGKGDLEQATACRKGSFGDSLLFCMLRGLAVQVLTFEEWVKDQERLVLEYFGIGENEGG